MKVDASSAGRGGHANSCDELIVALSGSVLVECDNGEEHFAGTAQAILHCGTRPRFVDVDLATRCIDPAAVVAAINPRSAAILPVHLFGHPCDMPALMALAGRHGLAVVEDCGAILTNDAALAARLRRLNNYGFANDRISRTLGFNSRLDEIQAAILLALLPHLESGNAERRLIAARYRTLLVQCGLDLPPERPGCVYHQFAIACDDRDRPMLHLARAGIGSAVHYAPGLHRHPAFSDSADGPLPATDTLSAGLLSLPIQPEIAMATVGRIAVAVEGFSKP